MATSSPADERALEAALRDLLLLFEDRNAWVQGCYALTADGLDPTADFEDYDSGDATEFNREERIKSRCWCLAGGIREVTPPTSLRYDVFEALKAQVTDAPEGFHPTDPETYLILWNDLPKRTWQEVLDLIRAAWRYEQAR